MLQEIYDKICSGEDLRANLIELKRRLREKAGENEGGKADKSEDGKAGKNAGAVSNADHFREICGENYDVIMKCLVDPDPKVRKNAADILGILKVQEAADVLMDAYRVEETLYVRPDYVTAMAALDCPEYLEEFHSRLDELTAYDAPENEKKHVQAEIAALRKLILKKEGIRKHTFTGYERTNEVVLTTLPAFCEMLAADLPFKKSLRPDGVAVTVGEMNIVLENRYWQEMLFLLHLSAEYQADGGETYAKAFAGDLSFADAGRTAAALYASDLMTILSENHRGGPPFYFRVGITGAVSREEKSLLTKQISREIEETFGGDLVNSASHYEAEIRLAVNGEGRITPYLKLFTIPDNRFRYRRYHVSAGMKPFVAAGLIGLAKPYLKDHAQILDPFCGVGTLIIERRLAGPVRSAYGIDTFGEAIEKARRNAQAAGLTVNYINRDFFDFTHDYLFDEIITDLPNPVGDREETDAFYSAFLEKSAGLLSERGRIFCYTPETGMLKKHLRLAGRFRLLAEFPILKRSGTSLFVLERKN